MAIPSVVQGMIEIEEGKVFELDSSKGFAWLESISSFRFEPSGNSKPCTVRKEASAYWYGCRKVAGKVRKKYIGKSSEVTVAKLEEVAVALEVHPVPQANKVAEVAEGAEKVAEVVQDRLAALELQVANLQKAFSTLQEALPGKLETGDFLKLPKVDSKVAEQLQNNLGNLVGENEKLRADYDALLESSTHITNKLRQEVQELRSQLEQERADQEDKARERERERNLMPNSAERWLVGEKRKLQAELAELKQKLATASGLPEAADLLNQLKAKRKKSKADLTDLETILEILES